MAQLAPVVAAFGKELRRCRREIGLTQLQLAEATLLNPTTIGLLEAGKGRISTLERVLSELRVEIRSRQLRTGPVGPALRVLRVRRRISQRMVARALSVSRNTVGALESGGPGRVETMIRYAQLLAAELTLGALSRPASFHAGVAASSAHHGWETPRELADQLHAALGRFDLDPCAGSRDQKSSTVSARVRLTEEDDGLHAPWHGLVFVNPPYGRSIPLWVKKCAAEAEKDETTVIGLMPARTDTRWWHDFIGQRTATCFLRGRLKFGDGRKDAPFASAIVVWNGSPEIIGKLKGVLVGAWSEPIGPAPALSDVLVPSAFAT